LEVAHSSVVKLLNLDELGEHEDILVPGRGEQPDRSLRLEVYADGPTRVLRVSECANRVAVPGWRTYLTEDYVQMEVFLALEGIAVSIINETPEEILLLSVSKINLEYCSSTKDTKLEFSVGSVQLDNQLYRTPYSVILSPKPSQEQHIFFNLSVVRSNQSKTIDFYHSFAVQSQGLNIQLDEIVLVKAWDFFSLVSDFYLRREAAKDTEEKLFYPSAQQESFATKMVYFQTFFVYPFPVSISFEHVPGLELDPDSRLGNLLSRTGVLANIDKAPLLLSGLTLRHPFMTNVEMLDCIQRHFATSSMREMHKLVGSADFLGNPISLANNISTGVYDFFNEPAQGLQLGAREFGLGRLLG
jgi:vacuolar protein sorting-associated protein 13A/C